jgi:hypothetical protein
MWHDQESLPAFRLIAGVQAVQWSAIWKAQLRVGSYSSSENKVVLRNQYSENCWYVQRIILELNPSHVLQVKKFTT